MSNEFSNMSRDYGGRIIPAMPLRENFVNLQNPSVVNNPRLIYCVSAGDVTITWKSGSTDTISMNDDSSFAIDGARSLVVDSGIFHSVGKNIE